MDPPEDLRYRLNLAIDSVVRAVGRIVVCVEADAEVSTVMISSLSTGAEHVGAENAEDVVVLSVRSCGPV